MDIRTTYRRTQTDIDAEVAEVEQLRIDLATDPAELRKKREARAREKAQVAFERTTWRGVPCRLIAAFWRLLREAKR